MKTFWELRLILAECLDAASARLRPDPYGFVSQI